MDMHLRCGSVGDAKRLFAEMERKDLVSWNALMRGFVEREHCNDALGLFASMLRDGMIMSSFFPFAHHDINLYLAKKKKE